MKWIKEWRDYLVESDREEERPSSTELGRRLTDYIDARLEPKMSVVRSYLENGADPNAGGTGGHRGGALARAVIMGWGDMVELFLSYGADPALEFGSESILGLAIRKGRKGITRDLINAGADPAKGFSSMEQFKTHFSGDISWYERDLDELERRFRANLVRKKLF